MAQKPIAHVTDVTIGFLKCRPPVPIVDAVGTVPTGGWSKPELKPRVYTTPPADGIQDLDFLATPPAAGDQVTQGFTDITAPTYFMHQPPSWLRGVRVHAAGNSVERHFGLAAKPLAEVVFDDDGGVLPMAVPAEPEVAIVHEVVVGEVGVLALAGEACHRFNLVKLRGWPEVKTEFEMKCVTVFGKKICTKLPRVYHRSCELVVEDEVCWPTGVDIVGAIEDCGKQALAAGVLALLLTGNIAAGAAMFEGLLRTCLAAKGVEVAGRVRAGLRQRNSCGPWRPV